MENEVPGETSKNQRAIQHTHGVASPRNSKPRPDWWQASGLSISLALRARKGCHAQALHFRLHFVRNISRLRARTKVIAAFLQPVLYFLIRYQQTSYVLPPFLVPFLWLLVLFPVGGELSFHLILF